METFGFLFAIIYLFFTYYQYLYTTLANPDLINRYSVISEEQTIKHLHGELMAKRSLIFQKPVMYKCVNNINC